MSNGNPSTRLSVAQITAPKTDPAFDLDAIPEVDPAAPAEAGAPLDIGELLSNYERSRSPEDLAALPVRRADYPNGPRLYHLTPLTPRQYAILKDVPGEALRDQLTVQHACHEFTDHDGTPRKARLRKVNGLTIAEDSWLDALAAAGGAMLFGELADIILRRAEVGDDVVGPFLLRRGTRLPR